MDGFESNEGVIIIAATNRPDVLDPAILRPGALRPADYRVTTGHPWPRGDSGSTHQERAAGRRRGPADPGSWNPGPGWSRSGEPRERGRAARHAAGQASRAEIPLWRDRQEPAQPGTKRSTGILGAPKAAPTASETLRCVPTHSALIALQTQLRHSGATGSGDPSAISREYSQAWGCAGHSRDQVEEASRREARRRDLPPPFPDSLRAQAAGACEMQRRDGGTTHQSGPSLRPPRVRWTNVKILA